MKNKMVRNISVAINILLLVLIAVGMFFHQAEINKLEDTHAIEMKNCKAASYEEGYNTGTENMIPYKVTVDKEKASIITKDGNIYIVDKGAVENNDVKTKTVTKTNTVVKYKENPNTIKIDDVASIKKGEYDYWELMLVDDATLDEFVKTWEANTGYKAQWKSSADWKL